MNANADFDRHASAWLADGPTELNNRVLDAALREVHQTHQRRRWSTPWRTHAMTNNMRAAAGVAIVAIVGVGVLAFNLRSPGVGDETPAPTPTVAPTPSATTGPAPTVPPLTQTFTSTIHAIKLSYPKGWVTRAATEPWTTQDIPNFEDNNVDVMYDPALTDHMFLAVLSQSHAGKTREAWATALAAGEGCEIELWEPDWAGGTAWIARSCRLFFVAESDIGWAMRLYAPDLPPALDPAYDSLFDAIIGTVDIHAAPAAPTAGS